MRLGLALLAVALLAACGDDGPIDRGILIEHVTLIDGTDRGAVPAMAVAVSGDRIVAVGPAGTLEVGPDVARIDGTGKFLIPGLWDMHVHQFGYDEHGFPLFLANGVTTIRDVGGRLDRVGYLRQESRYRRLLGPRVLIAGPMLESEIVVEASQGTIAEGASVATPDSATAVAVVDSLARAGVDHIKVHGATPRVAYFAAAAAAKRHGLPLVGHVPDSVMPREAIEAGQRTIEHGSKQAFANSARGRELSDWMLARMSEQLASGEGVAALFRNRILADDSASAAYDLATAQEFARFAASRPVWFTPTLVVYRDLMLHNELETWRKPELRYVPRVVRDAEELPRLDPNATAADRERGREGWRRAKASFTALVNAGAKFLAGTDAPVYPVVPGFSLHEELALLQEIGLTPLRALQAATRNAAEAAGLLDEVGTIEVGKSADLVLLDADPLADLANTRAIGAVVTRGRLLDRGTLDRMLGDAEVFARSR